MTTKCYFDGSCDPNPGGEIGWGWIVKGVSQNKGGVPASRDNSNNVAEYMALYFLLQELNRLLEMKAISGHIIIHGDSKLVINQMTYLWRIKNGKYKPWAQKSKALLTRIRQGNHSTRITFKWIRRDKNFEADSLSKSRHEDEVYVSADWLKKTTKKMVEQEMITLEELVDYVMQVPGAK